MFILGYHFPKDMGNKIPDAKVVEKLDQDVNMSGVKTIKLTMTQGKGHDPIVLNYTNMDTFLAKALVHFFNKENDEKQEKYMIYTDRYQMSELSKRLDKDDETMALCKKFDSMEEFRILVA